MELSATDGGSIMEYDERARSFSVRAAYRTEPEVVERLRTVRVDLTETLVGRAALERRPIAVTDLGATELDPHTRILYDAGWRSLVTVPMLREGHIVGSLNVRRKRPGNFDSDIIDLLETFASQSVLALTNAQLYRELQEQSGALEVASRHKSEFLASMSHELRTPLNAVLGFSEVLLERMFGEINERQEEYLRDIHGSGQHLLELLNEILDLSKVEAGRDGAGLHPARPAGAAGACRVDVARAGGDPRVDLRVEVEPDVGEVYSDELRLKQVVLNLLTNAVKFTGEDGSVQVSARRVGPQLHIAVSDTGIGVPEKDRDRIFESFQQGGRGASREEGTGLGLTLSRRIVELLGGRLWLDSEVGVGSTFTFSLPAPLEPSGRDCQPSRPAADVVVIEDDRASLDLLTAYLSGAEVRVTAARDAASGLAAVRQERPAAVLLDIRLPDMDGWAVLEALKGDPATRSIPVVVVSMVDEPARGAELGAAAYLVKPVSRQRPPRCPGRGRRRRRSALVTAARVLVVEDNPKNLKLLRDVLDHSGYRVVAATTGEDGARLAGEVEPDLILMDLQLPGIDGTEALRRIRSTAQGASVPVLAVTAFAMDADRSRALDYGFDGYVQKPLNVRDLLRQVRDILNRGLPG